MDRDCTGEFDCGFRTASVDECTAHEAACSNRPEERAKRAAEAKAAEDERAKKEAAEKAKKKNWACACPLLRGACCLRHAVCSCVACAHWPVKPGLTESRAAS